MLSRQSQVDSFRILYGSCAHFTDITVQSYKLGVIYNLDSLYGVKRVETLLVGRNDSLVDISGLNNLKYLTLFNYYAIRNFPKLMSIDTIETLWVKYALKLDNDLSVFGNLKHVKNRIRFSGDGKLRGLNGYTCGKYFTFSLYFNAVENDLTNVLPKNTARLGSLHIFECENISMQGIETFDSINWIAIRNLKKCNFKALTKLKHLDTLSLVQINLGLNSKIEFTEIIDINYISNYMCIGDSMAVRLPKLKSIKNEIFIFGNQNLKSLGFLDHLPASEAPFRITIEDNLDLSLCSSKLVCHALKIYPDSVSIKNNAIGCSKTELQESCISSTSIDAQPSFDIFPNPTSGIIWLSDLDGPPTEIIIRNSIGQLVQRYRYHKSIDMSHLPNGLYFREMVIDRKLIRKKIVLRK